jgi:hypothetical protein
MLDLRELRLFRVDDDVIAASFVALSEKPVTTLASGSQPGRCATPRGRASMP